MVCLSRYRIEQIATLTRARAQTHVYTYVIRVACADARVQLSERARTRFAFLACESVRQAERDFNNGNDRRDLNARREIEGRATRAPPRIVFVAPINADN